MLMKKLSKNVATAVDNNVTGPDRISGYAAVNPRRRRFVQGLAAGSALAAFDLLPLTASATAATLAPTLLQGMEFDLTIDNMSVNFTGAAASATVINGSIPGPILRWKEGSTVTIRVTNRLQVPTSLHWHGILVPFEMDGVPGFSFPGIAPGETFVYRFKVKQSGTYWYHSHSGFQEQTGLYGALIIDPAGEDPIRSDRDHVVMLNDWSDREPEWIYKRLKQSSDFFNYQKPTVGDFFRDASSMGLSQARKKRRMWDQMRMNPTDLSDVSSAAFTYLVNGTPPAGNWTAIARAGEKVRLRLINGSSTTIFDVRIPGLKMTVVSADGQQVEPVVVDEIRLSVAETYDVIIDMPDDNAHTIFAQSIDRAGYARATLAPRVGMTAPVPALDPKTWLSMADMGMGDAHDMQAMEGMDGHDMSSMKDMNAGSQSPSADADMASMEHLETGPEVDSRAMSPSRSLSDPGPRLRDNGRRVLTYADLHTAGGPLDKRQPSRDITLHLTGNMQRFIWGFDGKKYSEAEPIYFNYGERVRITLINDSMMNHPIHLHGMFSEVESEDGAFQVRKHTVNVQPGKQISYQVTADELGQWAFHCHLLYHMEAGMFRKVVVA